MAAMMRVCAAAVRKRSAAALELPMLLLPAFREVNNGALAGMDNELAKVRYPGLFWNTRQEYGASGRNKG